MKMTYRVAAGVLMVSGMVLVSGCFRAEARLPERINIGGSGYGQEPIEPVPPADSSNPAALARENQQLRQQNALLARRLAATQAELKDTAKDLDDSEEEVDKLEEKIDDLEDRIEDLKDRIEDLQDELEDARSRR